MSFIEARFFIFAALTALAYYLLPKKCQWLVLLVASCIFYSTYGWVQWGFVLAAALIAWWAGRRMQAIYDTKIKKEKAKSKQRAKRVLLLAIIAIASMLVYAKIGGWVMTSITQLFEPDADVMQAIVALGISYYTFSLVSYLTDIYWRKDEAETNFFRLLLFVTYFPKVLQGPISRHDFLAPQLAEPHSFDYKQFCFGLQLMIWGCFKKLVIADRLAIFVNTVFSDIASHTGLHLLVAGIFSAVQIYCDFSGCMDIACGFSQALGITLEKNFNHPFFSRSAAEFWRRWHITLGTWFTDYIYMPVLTSPGVLKLYKLVRTHSNVRAGKAVMSAVALLAVWLFTGLWHGTGWNYIIWGLYWCVLILVSTVFAPEIKRFTKLLKINTEAGSWRIFQMVRTFMIFVGGHIITQSGEPHNILLIGERLIFKFHLEGLFDGSLFTFGIDRINFILLFICMFILWAVSMLQERGSLRERIAGSNLVFRWAIYYIAILAVIVFGVYGIGYDAASFIYMQF